METRNNEWNKESFLVCDKSLRYRDAAFFDWLCSEGFRWGMGRYPYGHTGCYWVYVNITKKLFIYGLSGYKLMEFTGNHAITIEEFKTIYCIYKKYEGKEVFVFNKEPFDYDFDQNAPKKKEDKEKKQTAPKRLFLIALLHL